MKEVKNNNSQKYNWYQTSGFGLSIFLCVFVSMYVPTNVSLYLCIDVSLYICIFVSMYLCIYFSLVLLLDFNTTNDILQQVNIPCYKVIFKKIIET